MTKAFRLTLFISLLGILVAACTPPPPPAPLPTRIPSTPFSTELAPVPTTIPAGFNADNPIQLVIVPADFEAATGRESELQDLLTELNDDIALEVTFVETQPEAMDLLCGSSGAVSATWLSGFAYAGAAASECGIPTLQLDRNTDGDTDTGEAGVVLLRVEFVELGLAGLITPDEDAEQSDDSEEENVIEIERRLCRTSIDDLYSWTIPLLTLKAEGVSIADLEDVQEFEDYDALLEAILNGDCAVTGLPLSLWEERDDSGEIPSDTVNIVATSAEFPYHVMVFPAGAVLDVVEQITDALLALDIAAGRSEPSEEETLPDSSGLEISDDLMQILFGEGYFIRAQASDFSEMMNFINESGIDLGSVGQ